MRSVKVIKAAVWLPLLFLIHLWFFFELFRRCGRFKIGTRCNAPQKIQVGRLFAKKSSHLEPGGAHDYKPHPKGNFQYG